MRVLSSGLVALCARYAHPFAHVLQEKETDFFTFGGKTDGLLTAKELAARLKVKPSTVREWMRRGVIPAIKLTPKVVRFDLDQVVESMRDGNKGVDHVDSH